MSSKFLIFADLETGGVLPQHPTIQLGAIATEDGREVAHFEQNIAFDVAACDPEALAMNHYSAEAWADAVTPTVAACRFSVWLRPYCDVPKVSKAGKPYAVARLAGYNIVGFDGPRLRALFGTQFFPVEYLLRDVLQRVIWYFDETGGTVENFKLTTVARYFGIPVDGAHGALADARICAAVLWAMREAW